MHDRPPVFPAIFDDQLQDPRRLVFSLVKPQQVSKLFFGHEAVIDPPDYQSYVGNSLHRYESLTPLSPLPFT